MARGSTEEGKAVVLQRIVNGRRPIAPNVGGGEAEGFGQIPQDDSMSARFFELLKVRVLAQALAVGEVSLAGNRLKLRLSPLTPLDPAQLMAWVRAQKEAQFNPDGTVLLPLSPGAWGPVRQAQEVLREWARLA